MPPAKPNPNHTNTTSWHWYEDEDYMPEGLMAIRLDPGSHPVSDARQLEEHPGRLDYMARLLGKQRSPECDCQLVELGNVFELDEEGGLIIFVADPTYEPLEVEDLPRPMPATTRQRKESGTDGAKHTMPRLFE